MFTKGKSPEPPQPPQARPVMSPAVEAPKRAPSAARAGPSLFSADVKMKGSIVSQGEVQIDGVIEGDIRASSLTIGDTGAVKGEVVAESVVVRGTVEGRIRARKVQLCTGAKVRGDIFLASLAIEPNAIFEGAVKHAQDPMADPGTPGAPPPVGT